MDDKSLFGNTLINIMTILNISGSDLARGINVDPSIVSRWKSGTRRIPAKSNYFELLSTYMSKHLVNTHQLNELQNTASNLNIDISDFDNKKNLILEILIISHQKKASTMYLSNNNNSDNNSNNNNNNISNLGIFKNFELILGHENIIEAGINLINSAPKLDLFSEEQIFISFFTEIDSFSNFEKISYRWYKTIQKTLNKNWNIVEIIKLNNNLERNMKIIRNIKRHASSKRYFPYYLKSGSQIPLGPLEFIIVPNVGVLLCLGANSENKFDSAYLYRDSSSIDIYTNLLKQALNQSSSLLKFFFSLENTNSVLSEIIKIEEKVGERLSISEKLSEITIPQNIYNKYTMMHSRCFQTQFHDNDISESTNNEISENIEFHKRRLDAFESQIKYNKFYCIFDKSFIEHFIKTGHYNLFLTISLEDIKLHLIHIINLLKKHENFEIALFDENIHNYKPKINWFLKGHEAMSIQSPKIGEDEDIEQIDSNNVYENLISNIYEPTIIHAFRHEFYSLWNDIPNENRDKKQVISWFENIVNSIKV